jgi:hypothetical protein
MALTGMWCVRNMAFASSKRVIGGERAGMGYRGDDEHGRARREDQGEQDRSSQE